MLNVHLTHYPQNTPLLQYPAGDWQLSSRPRPSYLLT